MEEHCHESAGDGMSIDPGKRLESRWEMGDLV